MPLLNKIFRYKFISIIKSIFSNISGKSKNDKYSKMLQRESISERFNIIYEKNFWKSSESASGEGSELAYTIPLRNWLISKVPKLNIDTFVDAPCGDFNWMKKVVSEIDVNYIGIDIVESIIKKNKEMYKKEKVNFFVANICKDVLPKCDILMVRDCLFHLSYKDINDFLKNIYNLDYKYLLTTSHIVKKDFKNSDILTGQFRPINLFLAPFNFDRNKIADRVNDFPVGHKLPREMVLINKINVPKSITSEF
jgi:hypothetical protein